MSATNELLAGLAQRGAKYTNIGDLTFWLDESGVKWCTQEQPGGELHLQAITFLNPEQAIAATLGTTDANPTQTESSGTCQDLGGTVDFAIAAWNRRAE